jgi:hypothetical protein
VQAWGGMVRVDGSTLAMGRCWAGRDGCGGGIYHPNSYDIHNQGGSSDTEHYISESNQGEYFKYFLLFLLAQLSSGKSSD